MILYFLNLIDFVTTFLVLSHGGLEANPIMRIALEISPYLFISLKLIPAFFLCKWLEKKAKQSLLAKRGYIFINIIYTVIVINNIIVFFHHKIRGLRNGRSVNNRRYSYRRMFD